MGTDKGERDFVPVVLSFRLWMVLTINSVGSARGATSPAPHPADEPAFFQRQFAVLDFILISVTIRLFYAFTQYHQHQLIAPVNSLCSPVDNVLCRIAEDDRLIGGFCVIDIKPLSRNFQHVLGHQLRLLINTGAGTVSIVQQVIELFRAVKRGGLAIRHPKHADFRITGNGIEHRAAQIVLIALAIASGFISWVEIRQVLITRCLYGLSSFAKVPVFPPGSRSRPVFWSNPGDVVVCHIRKWCPW